MLEFSDNLVSMNALATIQCIYSNGKTQQALTSRQTSSLRARYFAERFLGSLSQLDDNFENSEQQTLTWSFSSQVCHRGKMKIKYYLKTSFEIINHQSTIAEITNHQSLRSSIINQQSLRSTINSTYATACLQFYRQTTSLPHDNQMRRKTDNQSLTLRLGFEKVSKRHKDSKISLLTGLIACLWPGRFPTLLWIPCALPRPLRGWLLAAVGFMIKFALFVLD